MKTANETVKGAWWIDPRVYGEAEQLLESYSDEHIKDYRKKVIKVIAQYSVLRTTFRDKIKIDLINEINDLKL